MTTTITTGVLGVGGLGAATAVAGAVGLGLLGAAALAGFGRRRGGGRRRGRSAKKQSDEALNNVMNLIRQEDITGCGMRLMCELAAKNGVQLTEEEQAILGLVSATPVVRPGEGILPPGGVGDFTMAKSFGLNGEDCGQLFPLCPLNGTQLMNTVMKFLP